VITTISRLYYDPARPSEFSNLQKLRLATARKCTSTTVKNSVCAIRAWLQQLNAYTLLRPARKRFTRNTYTVTNMLDVWECDMFHVQAYAKYNDIHREILSVIDVFSKFLLMVPLRTKSRRSVASSFQSIFDDPNIRGVNGVPYGYELITARNF